MLFNAQTLNAGLLNAAAVADAPEEGVFLPRGLASTVVFGVPQWLVHMAFEVSSVASTRVGVPTLVLGATRRFDVKAAGPLARAGMPALRLVYAGGGPPAALTFTAGGLRFTKLGTAQLQLRIALQVPSVASTRIGLPSMRQVVHVSGIAPATRLGVPVLRVQFQPLSLMLGRLGPPTLVQVLRPTPLARTRLGVPTLHMQSDTQVPGWYPGVRIGVPQLGFVHHVRPGSRLARVGQPSLFRGHAC